MLTVFAVPKPFHGQAAIAQRNAIQSWKQLHPACEVLLFGDEDGTAEVAAECGTRHVPEIERSPHGTPLVSDAFAKAEQLARYDVLCYINADIILLSDFRWALEQVASSQRRFLMVGQRLELSVAGALPFGPGWEAELRERARRDGRLASLVQLDYFLTTRGLWRDMPPFAVGRGGWDPWMVYSARKRGITVIDATACVIAVHQQHDYSHYVGGEQAVMHGPEAQRNIALAGGEDCLYFCIADATHVLTPRGVRLAFDRRHLARRFLATRYLRPRLGVVVRALLSVAALSRPLRSRLGLTLTRLAFD